MLRMRIPQLINERDELNVRAKDDDDQMMGRKNADDEVRLKGYGKKSVIKADIDWKSYVKNFESIPKEQLAGAITKTLLQTKAGVSNEIIRQYSDASGRENFIKSATLQLMSTPEYQLC